MNFRFASRRHRGDVQVEFLANLTRHQKAVNAVRFSPNGIL